MSGSDQYAPTDRLALADLDGEPHARVFPNAEPKTVRLSLDAGEAVAEHDHPGRQVVVHVLDGRVRLELDGEAHTVAAGELLRFDGRRSVRPVAEEASTVLIVLAPSPDE